MDIKLATEIHDMTDFGQILEVIVEGFERGAVTKAEALDFVSRALKGAQEDDLVALVALREKIAATP